MVAVNKCSHKKSRLLNSLREITFTLACKAKRKINSIYRKVKTKDFVFFKSYTCYLSTLLLIAVSKYIAQAALRWNV